MRHCKPSHHVWQNTSSFLKGKLRAVCVYVCHNTRFRSGKQCEVVICVSFIACFWLPRLGVTPDDHEKLRKDLLRRSRVFLNL